MPREAKLAPHRPRPRIARGFEKFDRIEFASL